MKLRSLHSPSLFSFFLALILGFGAGCKKEESESPKSGLPPHASIPKPTKNTESTQQPISRHKWNLQTTVAVYQKSGDTNRVWNQAAIAALNGYASLRSGIPETNGGWAKVIATNSESAVRAGCKDPLVEYVHARFLMNSSKADIDETSLADDILKAATKLQSSSYPPVHKFYATVDADVACSSAFSSKVYGLKTQVLTNPVNYASEILKDPDIPIEEAFLVCQKMLEASDDIKDVNRYKTIYQTLEGPMLRKWPKDYRTWLLKGEAYVTLGWIYRGSGTADTITEEGWKNFVESLAEAQSALEKGWTLNQTNTAIPLKMMTVALGGCGGKTRDLMELWFERAMKVDSNCVAACRSKLYFMEPKWHGSDYFQLAFGRECVESTQWGGRVPLMLVEVHEQIAQRLTDVEQKAYWKRPSVWLDIEEAFEKYQGQNLNATNSPVEYIRYAIRCERWDKVKELLTRLSPTDQEYLGGMDKFKQLVQVVNALAPRTRPVELNLAIDGQRSMARLINRLDMWMTSEEEDEAFKTYEQVLDKYPNATAAERVALFMNEATLCAQQPMTLDRAKRLYDRIKKEFPDTQAAKEATRRLAALAGETATPLPRRP